MMTNMSQINAFDCLGILVVVVIIDDGTHVYHS